MFEAGVGRHWIRRPGWLLAPMVWLGCSVQGLIYPAPGVEVGEPPEGFAEVLLPLSDGSAAVVWHLRGDPPPGRAILLFFHGNGENLETLKRSGILDELARLGIPVIVDYPGYGRSGGKPSERSLKAAAEQSLTWARDAFPDRLVVVIGWSLGAALAIHLASSRPTDVDALVAMSPWLSLSEVATGLFPRWLVSIGLHEEYDSQAAIRAVRCPALILHGSADSIIPSRHGEELAADLATARWNPIEGAGHNDLLGLPIVWQQIDGFVSTLKPRDAV